jgi:hypothetical protein
MIPFFVYYNVPEQSESLDVAMANSRSSDYMAAYFRDLSLLLEIINRESPDDPVGILLEPDFLGYLAQGVRLPANQTPAATNSAYTSGVLNRTSDPVFPDTIRGLVEAINYLISSRCGQCYFGWHMNLWASPAGGWTTPIPARGIIRVTDNAGIAAGRQRIAGEAAAITEYYLGAGVATRGAQFLSIDKYGLDATGFEPAAAQDPAGSTWFWNAEHWGNYLTFVDAVHQRSGLPIVLWQLPVGRINSTLAANPFTYDGRFPGLRNTFQSFEDSAPTYFLGDSFTAAGPRYDYFARNRGADPLVSAGSGTVTWTAHADDAARAGVTAMLFGAGVGSSTTNIGAPPTDGYWWIVKAQQYLRNPVVLAPTRR